MKCNPLPKILLHSKMIIFTRQSIRLRKSVEFVYYGKHPRCYISHRASCPESLALSAAGRSPADLVHMSGNAGESAPSLSCSNGLLFGSMPVSQQVCR